MMPIIIVPAAATANVNMANAKVCISYTILGNQAHCSGTNEKRNASVTRLTDQKWHTAFLCVEAVYAL